MKLPCSGSELSSIRARATLQRTLATLVLIALSVTTGSIHAQLIATDVYESGAEGEIWRFMGSMGASYGESCTAAGHDKNTDCYDYLAPAADELWEPIGFDIFDDGTIENYRLYVADRFNWRVIVYDYYGQHLQTVDSFPGLNGIDDYLAGPEGVTVDASGNIAVTDTYNDRVVFFDPNFRYRFELNLPPDVQPAQIAFAPGTTVSASADGCATPGPVKVALTTWSLYNLLQQPDQDLTDKNQVLLYDEHMCRVGQLGQANASSPQGPGSFFLPGAPAIGPSGEIYVAAYQENKIEVFWPDASDPSGYVRTLGINTGEPNTTVLDGNNQVVALAGPYGVMVDFRGRLVVGDTNNNRVAVFLQPWHPENTSPRDPANPTIGTHWQFAFELVAGGNIAGSWLAVVREDSWGRWLGSSVVRDLVYVFQVPDLAVANAEAAEVAGTASGDVLRVRADILVPIGKNTLTDVIPGVEWDALNPETNRASLGPADGPYLADPSANIFDPLYAGTPILDIDEIQPGRFVQVYWDFPVQSDGQAQFWISARKITGLADDIVADPKAATAESIPGTCSAPVLNAPLFNKPRFQTVDASTGLTADVYGNPVTVTLSAEQLVEGVREIQFEYLEGILNGTSGTLPGASGDLALQVPFSGSLFWTVKYRAIANCGAPSAWATTRFKIDAQPPKLGFGPVAPAASGLDPENRRWYSAPEVTMQVVASDDDTFSSNVSFPDFPTALNGQLLLSFTAEGSFQRQMVRVQDPVGNEFGEWSNIFQFIHIDRSAPQLTLTPLLAPNAAGWYRTDVPFRARAQEVPQLSGVKVLTSPDGLAIVGTPARHLVEGDIVRGGEGDGLTVSAVATDYASNSVTIISAPVRIDRTLPVVTIAPDPSVLYLDSVDVQLSASDPVGPAGGPASGVLRTLYQIDGGAAQLYGAPFTLGPAGITSVTFWTEDVAGNGSAPQTVVYAINGSPSASDASYTTNEDVPVRVIVSASDPENDALAYGITTAPVHGSVVLDATTGTGTYTPNANYHGPDSFVVTVSADRGGTATATVSITVLPINDTPVAQNDGYATTEDTTLTVPAAGVLANDTDDDGDALTAVLVGAPAHGTLTINGDGSFTYAPHANFNGSDTFTYRASDGTAESSLATVTITVTAMNDPPVAANDSYSTNEDTPLTVPVPGVLANDTDIDGDPLAVELVSGVMHGTLTVAAEGSFVYVPAANFFGADSFSYRVRDGATASGVATVLIAVAPVNDAPVAQDLAASTIETDPVSVAPLYTDVDAGDTLTVSLLAGAGNAPANGTVLYLGGVFHYLAHPGFTGMDTFKYRVSDAAGASATATVTITVRPRNQAPVCTAASASPGVIWPPNHKQTHEITIVGVVDPDGDPVNVTVTRILQDEPTETIGDGNTPIDGGGLGTPTAWVRAERMGPESDRTYNNGRLYEISFTATDSKGASCTGTVAVGVPHDQGQGANVIDNGCRWDSTTGGPVLYCAPGAVLPRSRP